MNRILTGIATALFTAGMIFSGSEAFAGEQRPQSQQRSQRGQGTHRGGATSQPQQPQNQPSRPGGSQAQPSRPVGGGNGQGSRPGNQTRPSRPEGNNQGHQPAHQPGHQPVGPDNRPGGPGHGSGNQPGHNPGHGPGHGPGSAPRPGFGAPGMTPPPPGGPRPWSRPMPPRPPRGPVMAGVPTIPGILGLTFGTLINYGLNELLYGGYNVVSHYNDAICLANVYNYGLTWPEATMFYNGGLLTGARFQYATMYPGFNNYNIVYSNLVAQYGMPVSTTMNNGITQSTWWGGGNTGYITLSYGPGLNQYGNRLYYTDLIYGN